MFYKVVILQLASAGWIPVPGPSTGIGAGTKFAKIITIKMYTCQGRTHATCFVLQSRL